MNIEPHDINSALHFTLMVNQTVKIYAIAQQTSLVTLSIMLKLD